MSVLARLQTGSSLHQLDGTRATALVEEWTRLPLLAVVVHALATVHKLAHFDREDIRGNLRQPLPSTGSLDSPRWMRNVLAAHDIDEDLECDAVVVGTGAGGAVVGRQLASQGKAVVFVEEGRFRRRDDFPGSLVGALTELYETVLTVGNSPMLIPRGRLVGGSTAVNGGTSFRVPEWVAQRWAREFGSRDFGFDELLPHYEAVERFLQVERPTARAVGPFHHRFEDGCRKLGWHHDLVNRNAPGCRGEGFCDTGCRSGARRSTDVSYIPDALERGAVLLTGLSVDEISIEGGRAVGVQGWTWTENGQQRRCRVRARSVILATGALVTPLLLQRNRIGVSSGQLGRNLTVHPSGANLGLYEEQLEVAKYIPQADYSAQFLHEGLLLLTAHPDEHVLPTVLSQMGAPLMRSIRDRHRIAGLGFLASDRSTGRIRVGPGGRGIVTYRVSLDDVRRFHRAQVLLSELSLACGAREVYPGLRRPLTIRGKRELADFRAMKLRASDFALTAFHPLGTCRMSPSPTRGIVDLNHQTFDLARLFVVDGSVVSGPLGVNPQLTIMALSHRAAEKIGHSLDSND